MMRSLLLPMGKQQVEPTANGGGGHHPRRDREGQGQHRVHLPCEGGGEGGGEKPRGEPGPAARRGAGRREVEAANGAEEEEQVEVGKRDVGHLGAVAAAADDEEEVDGEADEDPRGGPGEAAGAGGRRRRGVGVVIGGFRVRHRG
uniref:Uncharacterized protein n=1 Tax=Arundo donax TaxID=35708 RepID=A0A0A9GX26_ARUDO